MPENPDPPKGGGKSASDIDAIVKAIEIILERLNKIEEKLK